VDGVHDMGGMHGFGPVVPDDAIFHAGWEARLFALTEVADALGLTAGHFRETIEAMPPGTYLTSSYYERWLFGLERRLQRAGTIAPQDVDGVMARLGDDLPQRRDPALAAECLEERRSGDPLPRAAAPRFAPGERVRVRRMRPGGHTRCPRYVRGAAGLVDSVRGVGTFPDFGPSEGSPEPVYSVAFASDALFGSTGEPAWTVRLDLYESYLEPA